MTESVKSRSAEEIEAAKQDALERLKGLSQASIQKGEEFLCLDWQTLLECFSLFGIKISEKARRFAEEFNLQYFCELEEVANLKDIEGLQQVLQKAASFYQESRYWADND